MSRPLALLLLVAFASAFSSGHGRTVLFSILGAAAERSSSIAGHWSAPEPQWEKRGVLALSESEASEAESDEDDTRPETPVALSLAFEPPQAHCPPERVLQAWRRTSASKGFIAFGLARGPPLSAG